MNAIQALKELPLLVERKIRLAQQAAMLDLDLKAAILALGPTGWNYEAMVRHLTAAETTAAEPVPERPAEPPSLPVEEVDMAVEPAPDPEPAPELPEPVPPWDEPKPAETPAAPLPPEQPAEGWLSVREYAELIGVTEPIVYQLIARGTVHGPAVQQGPPKRVQPERAHRQILAVGQPGKALDGVRLLLGLGAPEAAAEPENPGPEPDDDGPALSLSAAIHELRRRDYSVLELGRDSYTLNQRPVDGLALIAKATDIVARERRLAAARLRRNGDAQLRP